MKCLQCGAILTENEKIQLRDTEKTICIFCNAVHQPGGKPKPPKEETKEPDKFTAEEAWHGLTGE